MSKGFKSVLDASEEDHIFTVEVEVMINRLEDVFDECGTPAIIAALICATHHAKGSATEEEFLEFVRSLYARDFSSEKDTPS
jgi:hypothetical protein